MTNWTVDGVNQLNQQWFWFRVGSTGPEAPINSIGLAPIITTLGGRSAYISYYDPIKGYGVEVDYLLTGLSAGSRSSDISESLTITNGTASPMEFHLYQYSDFQLAGDNLHNTAQVGTDIYGKYDEAIISKSIPGNNSSLSETVVSPGADRSEVALAPFTFGRLTDGSATPLNNSVGPTAVGDATWAFEWDFTIDPFSSLGISKDKYLHWEAVPEPSAALLIPLGFFGLALLRRKKLAVK